MSIAPGTRIGAYEIATLIGVGGMGEVHRARDRKLDRDVAIKVLPDSLATDPERLARFEREAKTLASLNHQNIAQIFGVEDSTGTTALVMELVEGPTLADRVAHGAIPIAEVLPIAKQIAEALEAAHDHGIVHRDLKPANIKVRDDGTVKVLDFGLAKAMVGTSTATTETMNSPTLTAQGTIAGIILGTAAYMSPEQAKGKPVDKRADVWAFGCVMFEMLTGTRAFGGENATDALVSLMSAEPDWAALPGGTPPSIHRLVRRSLDKDPKRRLDSMGVARLEIEEALAVPSSSSRMAGGTEALGTTISLTRRRGWASALPWIVAATVAVAAVFARGGSQRVRSTAVYASLEAPAGFVLGEDDEIISLPTRTPFVFTPDGASLIILAAKAGKAQLFIRSLDRPDARPVAGTDDARGPFVSPDGKWVGFGAPNAIKKVPIEGGSATTVCATRGDLGPFGAAWGPSDVIVFGDDDSGRLMRVSANGGTPTAMTPEPAPFHRHVMPVFLPDGKRVLYTDVSQSDASDSNLMVQSLDGGGPRLMLSGAADARLLPTGRLAFMRLGVLMTVAFDVMRAETYGNPVVAMDTVMQSALRSRAGADATTAGMFSVSSLGALAVIRGSMIEGANTPLRWVDREGRATSAEPASGAPRGGRVWMRMSPDRTRSVVVVQTAVRRETWMLDWTRDVWTPCRGCLEEFGRVVWSPDGRRLVSNKKGALVVHTLDESTPDEELFRDEGRIALPAQWLADGRLLFLSTSDLARFEVKVLDRQSREAHVVATGADPADAEVSPDGRWLAYSARQNGQRVVMVQAFPGPGSRVQISAGLGFNLAWSGDGRTIYYLGRTDDTPVASIIFAVDIHTSSTLEVGKPRELFRYPTPQACTSWRCYDLWPDGSRFLFKDRPLAARDSVSRMDLVLNWLGTLPSNR